MTPSLFSCPTQEESVAMGGTAVSQALSTQSAPKGGGLSVLPLRHWSQAGAGVRHIGRKDGRKLRREHQVRADQPHAGSRLLPQAHSSQLQYWLVPGAPSNPSLSAASRASLMQVVPTLPTFPPWPSRPSWGTRQIGGAISGSSI